MVRSFAVHPCGVLIHFVRFGQLLHCAYQRIVNNEIVHRKQHHMTWNKYDSVQNSDFIHVYYLRVYAWIVITT